MGNYSIFEKFEKDCVDADIVNYFHGITYDDIDTLNTYLHCFTLFVENFDAVIDDLEDLEYGFEMVQFHEFLERLCDRCMEVSKDD